MSKKSLTNGVSLKVENRSGFDKSFFNALTTGVGTITPICKQLMIPNSSGHCRVKISAQLPPLASDAFLRTHLKLEAFFVPLRLCYGGFESWFCGREVYDSKYGVFHRAKLPRLAFMNVFNKTGQYGTAGGVDIADKYTTKYFGVSSLGDYFGLYFDPAYECYSVEEFNVDMVDQQSATQSEPWEALNIFPWLCYGLIYDEFYRNKFVEKPLFSPPSALANQNMELDANKLSTYNLPYIACGDIISVLGGSSDMMATTGYSGIFGSVNNSDIISDKLLNGNLVQLRQRNYGDDYFTAAMPSAQEGNPVSISTSGNSFTIGSLRLGNALQEFAEISGYASPDYIQTLTARYGSSLKYGVAQKPVFVGSADFPMYTSGVEQTAQGSSQSVNTPFDTVGARYGRAHAEGTEFVCNFDVDEPGYFMVLATLVPEAQYSRGVSKDLQWFLKDGSITDLPCATLENIGNETIAANEIDTMNQATVFGYVQRYLAHKLGNRNQVHGLFRLGENLQSFVVQRYTGAATISSQFLKVQTTDLDNVAAVSSGISNYGVLVDSAIDLFVSEPLSESAIPSLVDPAKEHGHSVYVKTGGSKLA